MLWVVHMFAEIEKPPVGMNRLRGSEFEWWETHSETGKDTNCAGCCKQNCGFCSERDVRILEV